MAATGVSTGSAHPGLAPARVWTAAHVRAAVAVIVGVVYVAALSFNVGVLLSKPGLSLRISSSPGPARVAWVLPGGLLWSDGVRPGDRILALDGRPVAPRSSGAWSGNAVLIRTVAGTTVALDASALRAGHTTWPLLALSPWNFLLGALVLLRARHTAVGRAAFTLFACAAFALALAPGADDDRPATALAERALVVLFSWCWLNFFLTFPRERGSTRSRAALLAPVLAGIALGLAGLRWPALYEPIYLLRLAVLLVYLPLGAGLLAYNLVSLRDRAQRQGLAIVAAGAVAGVLPFAMLFLLPTLRGGAALTAPEYAILGLALLPFSIAYATVRHGVLDVPLLQRWLAHGLLWVCAIALGLAALTALERAAHPLIAEPARTVLVGLLCAAGAGLFARGPYDWLQVRLDRLLFKDVYDYRTSMQRLSEELTPIGDLASLGAAVSGRLCDLMNAQFVVLLTASADGGLRASGAAGGYRPEMLPALRAATAAARDEPATVFSRGDTPTVFVVPLRTHEGPAGYLCLGPKASGEPFRPLDRDLLATLSGHLAASVRNVQLVDDLRARVGELDALAGRLRRVQEEERERIAANIHDEALQTVHDLLRRLRMGDHNRRTTADHVALCEQLEEQLYGVCAMVRPAALDGLGLAAALDVLAQHLSEHANVPIRCDVDPEVMQLALSPEIELTLYRAAQGALNNALRHAHPGMLLVTLRRTAAGVQLQVIDNGDGFAVPASMDQLAAAGHLGLAGLHHRVQRAGGRVFITSARGRGTTVQVHFAAADDEEDPE